MGVWGTAIFSDDIACDVRADYRDLIGDGLSGPDATDRLLNEWRETPRDPDAGPAFWLALAATQWKCGRLEARVREKALEVIASGSDLRRWADDPELLRKRKAVLAKLEEQLRSPQPAEKRVSRRFRDHCTWEVGEVIGYQLLSGKWTLFLVIRFHSDKGGICPICELLDWVGDEIPSREELAKLAVRRTTDCRAFMIGRTSKRDLPLERVRRLGVKLKPTEPYAHPGYVVVLWRSLDSALEEHFSIR
jgi:hypothetical protein